MATRSVFRLLYDVAPVNAGSKRYASTFVRQSMRPQAHPRSRLQLYRQAQRQQCRGQATTVELAKDLWRRHPYTVSLAAACILFASGCIVYANYLYSQYIIAAFHKYPEPVAQKLRKALYFTNTDLQPKEALKFYKQALEVANELGMDPFSNEIIGVKVQVAALMEKCQNYPKAIEVLEILKRDCLRWEVELGGLERNKEKRTRVLKQTIAVSIKLGELYSNEYVKEPKAAEERLVWAVEATLREKQRREAAGITDGEGEWMSNDEMGASMEALAHNYEEQDKHYLATPLFLQALSLKPTEDCHSVVLMNNLSISLAQQQPPLDSATAPPDRTAMVENARQWAQKALDVAAQIKPPVRDEECDYGCAVALHNLGEFAEMNNNVAQAKKMYNEAASLAKAIGFSEGVTNSQKALRRISKAG
ncbi:hypothetical protein MBLNU459_g0770t1 [Dothideomycetes sp. NU459]